MTRLRADVFERRPGSPPAVDFRVGMACASDPPDEERPEPTCPRCGHEIDPTTCHCGDAIDGRAHDNHYPVPMGCRCHEMPIDLGGEG